MCVYYSGIEIEPYLLPLASCFSIETVMKRKMWTIDCFMEIGGLMAQIEMPVHEFLEKC